MLNSSFFNDTYELTSQQLSQAYTLFNSQGIGSLSVEIRKIRPELFKEPDLDKIISEIY